MRLSKMQASKSRRLAKRHHDAAILFTIAINHFLNIISSFLVNLVFNCTPHTCNVVLNDHVKTVNDFTCTCFVIQMHEINFCNIKYVYK